MIEIVFVEDDEFILEVVKRFLEFEPDLSVIAETPYGKQAIALVRKLRPQVVLLDISLADCSGLDILEALCKTCPRTRVVVYSLRDYAPYVDHALRNGASRFISKIAPIEELIEAIRCP